MPHAARHAPESLCDRLEEEWLADLSERSDCLTRLNFALGCYWAAAVIRHDHPTLEAVPLSTATADNSMSAYFNTGLPPRTLHRRRSSTWRSTSTARWCGTEGPSPACSNSKATCAQRLRAAVAPVGGT